MTNQLIKSDSATCGRARCTIGIDVGGTNTDAVLYDKSSVMAFAKIPTRHPDYASSAADAIRMLLSSGIDRRDVLSLNISTTLSTNAILEKKGALVNLVLIGFERYPHIYNEIISQIAPASLLSIAGGHTVWGKQKERLDEATLAEFAYAHKGELFAVSAMYSTRNPEHETRAKKILLEGGCAGVTCGHELARSRLNALKRTITAYLNSSLIPLTERLILGIERAATENSLYAPMMFLRSDSSLVSAAWCRRFPIETVFSGPAASVRGGRLLAGDNQASLVIADMGGTSTDIGAVRDGRAVFTDDGAVIGGFRTMIPSLDINTIALGGDSLVKIDEAGDITVGPHRALPLCRLREYITDDGASFKMLLARASGRVPEFIVSTDSASGLERGVVFVDDALAALVAKGATEAAAVEKLTDAIRLGSVLECGFTPTDALNVLGLADIGETKDSIAAEEIFEGLGCRDVASKVCSYVRDRLKSSMDAKANDMPNALRVCVGAPVKAFAPHSCGKSQSVTPENRAVAGALGAAASSIELTCGVSIVRSFSDDTFTAFLPTETLVSDDIDDILAKTERSLAAHMSNQARQMGCSDFEIRFERNDIYLGRKKTPGSLSSAVITGKVFVHGA